MVTRYHPVRNEVAVSLALHSLFRGLTRPRILGLSLESLWFSATLSANGRRTSVEMIEKYYAAHIKTNLDAAEINKMRPRLKKKQGQPKTRQQPQLPIPETDV
jgi:hypothetical protein